MSVRVGVLSSTRGTNLMAVLSAIEEKKLSAEIVVVISNKVDAFILERARSHNIPTYFFDPKGLTRENYDQKLSQLLHQYHVDLVVLIGYMRILSNDFVAEWPQKIINVHPSLLPAFAGKMNLEVHRAVLQSGVTETGCTVHSVTEKLDAGPILLQKTCAVLPTDTPEILKARVQVLEGDALVEVINNIIIQDLIHFFER